MGRATFWATFSPTHLVTLGAADAEKTKPKRWKGWTAISGAEKTDGSRVTGNVFFGRLPNFYKDKLTQTNICFNY
jgi:hypothetical protein